MTKIPKNQVAYATAKQTFQRLPEESGNKLIVFIGYKDCPYSHKTLELIRPFEPNRTHFEVVNRAQGAAIKRQLGNDSFPIVFVKAQSGQLLHLGGADDLEELLEEVETPVIEEVEYEEDEEV